MKCPGQDSRYWKPGAIFEAPCPQCQARVEFFKDDTTRKCHQCGNRFVNPHLDFGCAAYCQFAEQCLGDLPPELAAQKEALLKDRVAIAMKRYFGKDFRRIGHATRVAQYAEKLGQAMQANPAVVLTAAYLHDIGIPAAEAQYGPEAALYHSATGVPIARELLTDLGARPTLIEAVCRIIGTHHEPPENPSPEFTCVFDADYLVNLQDRLKTESLPSATLETLLQEQLLSREGRLLARDVLAQYL